MFRVWTGTASSLAVSVYFVRFDFFQLLFSFLFLGCYSLLHIEFRINLRTCVSVFRRSTKQIWGALPVFGSKDCILSRVSRHCAFKIDELSFAFDL